MSEPSALGPTVGRLVFWLLTIAVSIVILLTAAWANAIHGQLAEIKGAVQSIATSQASFATEIALLKMRVDQVERAIEAIGRRGAP